MKTSNYSACGFTLNMTLRSLKCGWQKNKQTLSRQHTFIFHSKALRPKQSRHDMSIKQKRLTVQAPFAPDRTCYSPSLACQSSMQAHTSNSHSTPVTTISFPSLSLAEQMRFSDNNGCRGGPWVNNDWLQGLGLVMGWGSSVWPLYHQCALRAFLPTVHSMNCLI